MQYEENRITLVQAVLLMGFWYPDTRDRTGPWHWLGVAISLCQTMGLHRKPDVGVRQTMPERPNLWRKIWWACVHREVWFSVGMGRPMRINLDDCDVDLPEAAESDSVIDGIPENLRRKYLPGETQILSYLWVELVHLAIIQANILSAHYRIRRPIPTQSEIEDIELQIQNHSQFRDRFRETGDDVVNLHVYHLDLFFGYGLLKPFSPCLMPYPGPHFWRCTGHIYLILATKANHNCQRTRL